jgi:alpha-tubulin suppressor-like RCC1 family protein
MGADRSCALAGGVALCWGAASDALGDGALADLAGAVAIGTGVGNHSCAIDAQQRVRCWGSNSYGQLGDGSSDHNVPSQPVLANVTSMAVGGDHTCVVSSGNVLCWGRNNYGQLGEPSAATPTRNGPNGPIILQGVKSVVGGWWNTCALLESGSVKCWGYNPSTNSEQGMVDVPDFCP